MDDVQVRSAADPAASACLAPSPSRPLRVLSIAHPAVTRGIGRLRYEALARDPAVRLTLLVPERWHEYGRDLVAEPPGAGLDVRLQPIRLRRAGPALWYLHHYPRLGALLREIRPQVIHLWEEPWSAVALQASWLRDRVLPGAALVPETEQNIFRRLPPPFEHVRRHVLGRTDLLVVRGEEALAVARRAGFGGEAQVVEYPVDGAVFRPGDRGAARARLGAHGFTLGYVGRLVPEKGLDEVLAAVAACPAPVTLFVLGDGPERAGLPARAAALGIGDRVRLFEPRPTAGVAAFMAALDALVLMSRTTRTWKEQFGRVIIEAQACGLPVIGSSSGAIPGVIGRGGWVVPEGDGAALAALLERLAHDPGEVAAVAARGHGDVLRRCSPAAVAGSLRGAWTRAAAARAGRPGAGREGRA